MKAQVIQHFWAKVAKGEGCWLWTASSRPKGYGAFAWTNDEGHMIQTSAHRFSWELAHGPIPKGMCVLHRCDTPACVNPDHLWLGTLNDNNQDMCRKGRHVSGGTYTKGKYKRGEKHHNHKMTEHTVRQMRADRLIGMSLMALSRKYGVGTHAVYKIVKRLAWKDVE